MAVWLAALVAQLSGLWHVPGQFGGSPAGLAPGPSGLMIVATVAVAALVVVALARGGRAAALLMAVPLTGQARAQYRKSLGAACQRQRDPGARGRARPRAPSPAPVTA